MFKRIFKGIYGAKKTQERFCDGELSRHPECFCSVPGQGSFLPSWDGRVIPLRKSRFGRG
jgi:hypothetical protein